MKKNKSTVEGGETNIEQRSSNSVTSPTLGPPLKDKENIEASQYIDSEREWHELAGGNAFFIGGKEVMEDRWVVDRASLELLVSGENILAQAFTEIEGNGITISKELSKKNMSEVRSRDKLKLMEVESNQTKNNTEGNNNGNLLKNQNRVAGDKEFSEDDKNER